MSNAASTSPAQPLLEVTDLAAEFVTAEGPARAVDGVSFTVGAGETVALVGESGCGKTATALAVMGLLPKRGARVTGGVVRFEGQDLLTLGDRTLRRLRGRSLSMIFQEPMSALNPVIRVGDQVGEVLRHHLGQSRRTARAKTVELFNRVGIADADRRVDDYPHELSGGLQQRVMIAMALACGPKLIIADEPTTALDVTVQAQILALLRELRDSDDLALLLITHDLGIVAENCDRVVVMYAGQVVETGRTRALFAAPRHPYTRGLLAAIPGLPGAAKPGDRLAEIPGAVPPITARPAGCRYFARCPRHQDRCERLPEIETGEDGHQVRCFFPHTWPKEDGP